MLAIGSDVHQKQTAVAILDSDTGEIRERKVPTPDVPEFLQEFSPLKRVVLEAGCTSAFLARRLGPLGTEVLVADGFRSHRFAEDCHVAGRARSGHQPPESFPGAQHRACRSHPRSSWQSVSHSFPPP
jgi:hypothetical protein